MLKVIKDWFSIKTGFASTLEALEHLHAGCSLRFASGITGTLVSRLAYKVTGTNSYHFDGEQFISYVLNGFGGEGLNLILVRDPEHADDSYFALSRPLSDEQMRHIIGDKNLKLFFSGTFPSLIHADAAIVQGWIADTYTRALANETGRFLEGDSRFANLTSRELLAQPFEYALYVDEEQGRAIEIEQYTDGRTRFFATLYLSVDAIEEVVMPDEPRISERKITNGHADVVSEMRAQASYELIEHEQPVVEEPAGTETSDESPDPRAVLREETPEPRMMSEPAAVEEASAASSMLELDAALAVRLIEEAMRNEMTLADLIRKIADLPRRWKDAVLIPIDLQDEDYEALGRKYGLNAQDRARLQERLRQELAQFAGLDANR